MKKEKIKFLATSDIHSDINLIYAIEKYSPLNEMDFIIMTGDISEKKDDFGKIFSIFKGKDIFLVPGNHETKKQLKILEEIYKIHVVGDKPVIINEDFAIFGTNKMSIGSRYNERDVLENLIENFKAIENIKFKVLLNHIPPHGTIIGDASPYFPMIGGSQAHRVFLEHFNPDISIVGHIHESSGLEEIVNKTKVINVARTFKVFEFDTKTKQMKILSNR